MCSKLVAAARSPVLELILIIQKYCKESLYRFQFHHLDVGNIVCKPWSASITQGPSVSDLWNNTQHPGGGLYEAQAQQTLFHSSGWRATMRNHFICYEVGLDCFMSIARLPGK